MSAQLHFHKTVASDDKPWLVLIHGLFGNLDNLAGVRRGMQDDFNVISVDLPDHGRSPWTNRFSFSDYAQHILTLLEEENINQALVLGHSLGGKVAMQLALQAPQRVAKLVLADIAPVAYPPRHQAVLSGLRAVQLDQLQDRTSADKQMAEFVMEAGVRQFLLKSLYQSEQGWKWRFNLDLLERDYPLLSNAIESDNAFDNPVLFIKGSESDYLLSEHQAPIAKLFPNSSAKIIQGTGHWLHAEKTAIFNRIAKNFLLSD